MNARLLTSDSADQAFEGNISTDLTGDGVLFAAGVAGGESAYDGLGPFVARESDRGVGSGPVRSYMSSWPSSPGTISNHDRGHAARPLGGQRPERERGRTAARDPPSARSLFPACTPRNRAKRGCVTDELGDWLTWRSHIENEGLAVVQAEASEHVSAKSNSVVFTVKPNSLLGVAECNSGQRSTADRLVEDGRVLQLTQVKRS